MNKEIEQKQSIIDRQEVLLNRRRSANQETDKVKKAALLKAIDEEWVILMREYRNIK